MASGQSAVAAAGLYSEGGESLPAWVDGNVHRQVAAAIQANDLRWYERAVDAMNAWDADLCHGAGLRGLELHWQT